jgi:glucokinase
MSRAATQTLIGVDIGATTTAAGLVTRTGEVLHTVQRPTHHDGPGTALAGLRHVVRELRVHAGAHALTIDGVGIGVAGIVDPVKRTMQHHPHNHLPELANVSLIDAVQEAACAPVFVENDVNAQALAEWLFGVGRGSRSLVLMAIGTSIGGGIILDGRLVRGANGSAGELHGIPIDFNGRHCSCGGRGCLGAWIEGWSIVGETRERLAGGAPSSLPAMASGDPAGITPQLVFQAAAAGDPLGKSVVDGVCTALAAGLAAIVNTLNPDTIVVTGGIARSLEPLAGDIRRAMRQFTLGTGDVSGTQIHVIGGDKTRAVRGGAALVLYETGQGA